MDKSRIPINGLPEELKNIPYGQIFVIINPFMGISTKNTRAIQFINQIGRQSGQHCIVNVIPVEYSDLWDCYACRIETIDGDKILLSDDYSLLEMLCKVWSLDFDAIKESKITIFHKPGEADHPIQISVPAIKNTTHTSDVGYSLGYIQTYTKEKTIEEIKRAIIDNFNYKLGISLEEIEELFNEEKNNHRNYHLDVIFDRKEEYVKGKPVSKIKECTICIIDNTDKKYPIKLNVYNLALYCTFLLYKDGLSYWDIPDNEEFLELFKKIYLQLPYSSKSNLPLKFDLFDNEQYQLFVQKIGKIRDAVMNATNNNYLREQFAIEGKKGEAFGIIGATEELRKKVKEEFGIK